MYTTRKRSTCRRVAQASISTLNSIINNRTFQQGALMLATEYSDQARRILNSFRSVLYARTATSTQSMTQSLRNVLNGYVPAASVDAIVRSLQGTLRNAPADICLAIISGIVVIYPMASGRPRLSFVVNNYNHGGNQNNIATLGRHRSKFRQATYSTSSGRGQRRMKKPRANRRRHCNRDSHDGSKKHRYHRHQ